MPRSARLERALAQPVDVIALAHLDVRQCRPNGRGHIGAQRPGRRGPHEQPLAGPVNEREANGQARVLAVLVALVHLHLADARAAARAPRHRVVALVQPAAPVALGQEAPDQVVVLVAEGEVRAAQLGQAQPPDDHLDRVRDRAVRPFDRDLLRRVLGEQVAQAAQLVGIVPVHPHAQADRLLGLERRVGQDALLAQADEVGDAVGLDVALARVAQLALDVDLDPQALAVEAVLVALVLAEHRVEALVQVLVRPTPGVVDAHRVVGRDRAVEKRPALVAGVLGAEARERPPLVPQREHLVLERGQIGLPGYRLKRAIHPRLGDHGPSRIAGEPVPADVAA